MDELDQITTRLVNELSSKILPALTRNLTQNNNNTQHENLNFTAEFEKAIKILSDENRAANEILMHSVNSVREEISKLKRADKQEKIIIDPEILNLINKLDENLKNFYSDWLQSKQETNKIIEHEFNTPIPQPEFKTPEININADEIFNKPIEEFENIIRAHDNIQTQELKALSHELENLTEQNNLKLNHEIKKILEREIIKYRNEIINIIREQNNLISSIKNTIYITGFLSVIILGALIFFTR